MALVLVFNPGSASLKFDLIETAPDQKFASEGRKLLSGAVEGIGASPQLLRFERRQVAHREPVDASDFAVACRRALSTIGNWIADRPEIPGLDAVDLVGVRVVHGADRYDRAVRFDDKVRASIEESEELAPLHNRNSLTIIDAVFGQVGAKIPVYAAFDTAFHRMIPERASLYAIPYELSTKHNIRRFGFHGLSHRYMMERYVQLTGKRMEDVSLVTLHLESGCSVTAICNGKSIDNTMGLTPLEGLMMGTRSGDVDPALLSFLSRAEGWTTDRILEILNHESGLQGVSGRSLDTRVLMQEYASNPRARLAMEMFVYRVRKAVGGYLAALNGAEAILFGGGIGEDTPYVRERVCEGFRWCGLELDRVRNRRHTSGEAQLSACGSSLKVYAAAVEEGLQIAHEAVQVAGRLSA